MAISVNKFREAMTTVEDYCDQISKSNIFKSPHQIGCVVKLSKFGREMQRPHNKIGKVVDWLEWHSTTDGLVTIKWDGVKKPDIMHVSQVEACQIQR